MNQPGDSLAHQIWKLVWNTGKNNRNNYRNIASFTDISEPVASERCICIII